MVKCWSHDLVWITVNCRTLPTECWFNDVRSAAREACPVVLIKCVGGTRLWGKSGARGKDPWCTRMAWLGRWTWTGLALCKRNSLLKISCERLEVVDLFFFFSEGLAFCLFGILSACSLRGSCLHDVAISDRSEGGGNPPVLGGLHLKLWSQCRGCVLGGSEGGCSEWVSFQMRPVGWGCVKHNMRESWKPGDSWTGLNSPPRRHFLLQVFEWLPSGRGVRFILSGKTEVKIRAFHGKCPPGRWKYEVCAGSIRPCTVKNRDIYWRQNNIQETLYTGQWYLSPRQSRHLGPSHSSPNCHQLPHHIFLNLINGLKLLPFQRWF